MSVIDAPDRLKILKQTQLLDSAPEEAFDRWTRLAARILNAPVSLVSIVDDERQFFKSCTGEIAEPWGSQRGTPLSHSFCKYVVGADANLVVGNAPKDPKLQDHPAVAALGVVAYLGIPLTISGGYTIGSMCMIDSKPREWTQEQIETLQDLAASVVAEIELRLMVRELQKSHLQLREFELQSEELADLMIKDLQGPLGSVQSSIELALGRCGASEMQRRFLDAALENTRTLARMVDTIVDQGADDRGRLEFQLEPVDLQALLQEEMGHLQASANRKSVRMQLIAPSHLPKVRADKQRIARVIANMMANALRHTPIHGCVRCSITQLCKGDVELLQLSIRDEASSIPQKFRKLVFDRCGQLKAKRYNLRTVAYGMPLSRVVIEGCGGEVWIESKLTEGTTYCLSLPLVSAVAD